MAKVVGLPRPFNAESGHAFTTSLPTEAQSYVKDGALSFVLEDGRALTPGNAFHDQIRSSGRGAHSLWGAQLYFSASDNSNCNTNGRTYQLVLVSLSSASDIHGDLVETIARDDALLLALFSRNYGFNNSFTLNFLEYYNFFQGFLDRHGVGQPRSLLELGCGERPYTALRFLLEGATRCVANDIARVERTLTKQFAEQLRFFVTVAWPARALRLKQILIESPESGVVGIEGLEVCDGRPFEEMDIDGGFDLIYSVSVLEHVMNPRGVVERMRELLRPGGYACHSIDLRDHSNFGDPLGFLKLSEDEYAPRRTENRLRAPEWFGLFAEAGFKLVGREFVTRRSADNPQEVYSDTQSSTPWVTADMRAAFAPPFCENELADLSTVAVRVLYQKAD